MGQGGKPRGEEKAQGAGERRPDEQEKPARPPAQVSSRVIEEREREVERRRVGELTEE